MQKLGKRLFWCVFLSALPIAQIIKELGNKDCRNAKENSIIKRTYSRKCTKLDFRASE